MVFKGRFFSSKKSDPSSPDGSSNSPRSLGSGSPIRSDKKKVNSAPSTKDNSPIAPPSSGSFSISSKKEGKGKETLLKSSSSSTGSAQNKEWGKASTGFSSSLKSKKGIVVEKLGGKDGKEVGSSSPASAVSMSPIVASSLGLNKIKTRSGPLPQESFFGFGSGRDKGSALGASNLSKPFIGGGDGGSNSGPGKKNGEKKDGGGEEKKRVTGNVDNAGWIDNGSNSDSMSTESGPSRDQSPHVQARSRLQNAESSTEAGMTPKPSSIM